MSNMKPLKIAILWLLVMVGTTVVAQSYSIDWFTIDGGGGTSTGGVYSVSGTIGQPDAGKMSGGNFTLEGGFWGIIAALQTPGAPTLSIARTTTNNVASVNGSNIVTAPSDDGTTKSFVVNPPAGNRFYRLYKP